MKLRFTKMHGLGNDFMVINGMQQPVCLDAQTISKLADRHTGIGFDQLLLVEASQREAVDFNYRIFNADGQEVGQCGNGARCMGLFIKHYGLSTKNTIHLATSTTDMQVHIYEDSYGVELPNPRFHPEQIPMLKEQEQEIYEVEVLTQKLFFHAVNLGNPHIVIPVPDISSVDVGGIGKVLSSHKQFPLGVNVGFMEIDADMQLRLRVYERGAGETRACGSGAAAAAVIARRFYDIPNPVQVSLAGGQLQVSWAENEDKVLLIGPAALVFEGEVIL